MELIKNESFVAVLNDTRDEYLAKCEICLLTSVLLVTFLGNGLILASLYIKKCQIHTNFTRMYFFILHLTIADLLTGFFNILPQLAWDITFRFQGGVLLCKAIQFLQPLGLYLNTYLLTAMAIDRYQAICHSLKYCNLTSKRSIIMVYCTWIISILLCSPQIFVFSYREILPNIWDCWITFQLSYEKIYVTWYCISMFLLPSTVLFYMYIGICISTWRTNTVAEFVNIKKYKTTNFLQQNYDFFATKALINSAKQTIILISLYLITRTPFIGCLLWTVWNQQTSPLFVDGSILKILKLLSSITSCINPWIYLLYNHELRCLLTTYFSKRDVYILEYGK